MMRRIRLRRERNVRFQIKMGLGGRLKYLPFCKNSDMDASSQICVLLCIEIPKKRVYVCS